MTDRRVRDTVFSEQQRVTVPDGLLVRCFSQQNAAPVRLEFNHKKNRRGDFFQTKRMFRGT